MTFQQQADKHQFSFIPKHLQDTICFQDGIIVRHSTKRHKDNKFAEFLYILQEVTGEQFDGDNYYGTNPEDLDNDEDYENYQNEEGLCICSQIIHKLYKITYKPSNITFQVGCECVKKTDLNLFNEITKPKCSMCPSLLLDRRTQPNKSGYCSEKCKLKHEKEIDEKLKIYYLDDNKMTHSNINPLDKTHLSTDDQKKLADYEIVDFKDLHLKDHFRYSSNKYKEQGRKLAYGVIHKIDRENKFLTVWLCSK